MDSTDQWLTLDGAAFILKVGVPTVESLINRGLLQAEDQGGETRIRREELVNLMRRNQQELDREEPHGLAQDFGLMDEGIV
jgi:excisionase family DNA binding protein